MKAIQIDDEVMARIVQELESGPRSIVLHYSYDVRVAGNGQPESIGTWRFVEIETDQPVATEQAPPIDAPVHRTDETPVARRVCGAQPDDEQWAEMGDEHKPVCQHEPGHDRVMRPGGLGKPVYWDHTALTSGGSTFMWNTRRTIGVGNEILVTPISPSGKTHELERDGRHPDEVYADKWLEQERARARARKADPPTREQAAERWQQANIEDTIGWAFGWDIEQAQKGDGGPEAELTRWWLELAAKESTRVVPKAIEYGAGDLVEIGRQLVQAGQFKLDPERTEASQLASLGVYFYLIGKVARWTSAIESGRGVSDDTLHDIGVYVRMAQRIREVGAWPGVQL